MDNIRLILLLVGAVIVLGIYVAGRLQDWRKARPVLRRPGRRDAMTARDREHEPLLEGLQGAEDTGSDAKRVEEEELQRLGQLLAEETTVERESEVIQVRAAKPAPPPCDKVFSLFVMAPSGVPFRGPVLLSALRAAGLEYGDMQIFHRSELVNGQQKHLFSVANIREPGILDPATMENFSTVGVALFMQVPGAVDAVRAFDAMVAAAKFLADKLDGTVCDATRSVMTNQTTSHLRDEVISCQLQQRMANKAS